MAQELQGAKLDILGWTGRSIIALRFLLSPAPYCVPYAPNSVVLHSQVIVDPRILE